VVRTLGAERGAGADRVAQCARGAGAGRVLFTMSYKLTYYYALNVLCTLFIVVTSHCYRFHKVQCETQRCSHFFYNWMQDCYYHHQLQDFYYYHHHLQDFYDYHHLNLIVKRERKYTPLAY